VWLLAHPVDVTYNQIHNNQNFVGTRKPPVGAALVPVTMPSQPTRAPIPLSVCSWLADTAQFDHAHGHRPAGQPASAAATVTDTTDNLVKLITV